MSSDGRARLPTGDHPEFRSLGVHERPVHAWYAQLRRVLETRLGKECADFYAEPVPDRDGFRVDWYAPVAGDARPLDDLPDAERQEVEERIADLLSRLRGLSDAVASEIRSDADRTRAQIVAQSISFPTREQVFVVGKQPVVTYWGFVREGADRPSTPVFARAAGSGRSVTPPPAPTPTPVPIDEQGRRRWWLWLLGLLALLLLAGWLLRQCPPPPLLPEPDETPPGGVATTAPVETPAGAPTAIDGGVPVPTATAGAGGEDLASLRAERDRLRAEYEQRLAQCGPGHEVPPREYEVGRDGEVSIPDGEGGTDGGAGTEPGVSPGAGAPSPAMSSGFGPKADVSPDGGREERPSPGGPDVDRSPGGPATPPAADPSPRPDQPTPIGPPSPGAPSPGTEPERTQNPTQPATPVAPQKSAGTDGGGDGGGGTGGGTGSGGGGRGPAIPIPPTLLPPGAAVPTPQTQQKPPAVATQVAPAKASPAAAPTSAPPGPAKTSAPPGPAPTSAPANPSPGAKRGGDPGFGGTWKGEADLAADGSQKRERVPVTLALDAAGNGTLQVHRPGGAICEAPVQGRPSGAQLQIQTTTPAICSDGQRYRALEVLCQPGAGAEPECVVDPGGQRSRLERSR